MYQLHNIMHSINFQEIFELKLRKRQEHTCTSLLQTTQLIKKITTLKKKREIDTVNQILFVMTLFCNLPDLNWFAATIVFAIKM